MPDSCATRFQEVQGNEFSGHGWHAPSDQAQNNLMCNKSEKWHSKAVGLFFQLPTGTSTPVNKQAVPDSVLRSEPQAPRPKPQTGVLPDPLNFQLLTFGADLQELRNRELNNGRPTGKHRVLGLRGLGLKDSEFRV